MLNKFKSWILSVFFKKKLEQEMFKHARNLEFEEAARIRDEVQKLRKVELGLPLAVAGERDGFGGVYPDDE